VSASTLTVARIAQILKMRLGQTPMLRALRGQINGNLARNGARESGSEADCGILPS
jgi:hypothetical protein